ncbi:hypothetical protein AB5J62_34830 [Amycolatopsis sp. cg5]|uniref:terpene synthase family protein n=1 Tax=Amycolatopsis sp. cg5 TaxID=3238802 RepID=UPI0035244A1F
MRFDLPPPYPPRRSPDVARARARSAAWARGTGIPEPDVWDEQDLPDFDFASFAALVHPDARGAGLELVTCWYLWSWYLDDLVMERFKRTRDLAGARAYLSRLPALLRENPPTPTNPVERGLADLWSRTTAKRDPAWRTRMAALVPNLFEDALWEIANLVQGRPPEPVDYLQMRRLSGGAGWAAQLVEHLLNVELPPALLASSVLTRLHDAFADVIDLHNDLVSYRRETEYEHELNNNVVVTQTFLGTGLPEATVRTQQLLDARLALFEHLAESEIPAFLTDAGISATTTLRYLNGLRDWLAGDYQWHLETARYRPASWERKRVTPGTPSGLGTAATRIRTPGHSPIGRPAAG